MTNRYSTSAVETIGRPATLLALVLACAVTPGGAWAQRATPEFQVDAVASRGPGASLTSKVDVYLRVPYENLTFVNSVDGFVATYAVTVEALAKEGDRLTTTPVETRVWDGTVRAIAYSETKEPGVSALTTQTLQLLPGSYQLSVQVEDRNSSESFVRDVSLRVRDFNRPVAVSDLTLLDSYDRESLSIVPRTGATVGTDEHGIDVFFEVYANRADTYRLHHDVVRLDRDSGVPSSGIARAVFGDVAGDVVENGTEVVSLRTGRSQHVVNVNLDEMKVGTYVMRLMVEDATGNPLDEAGLMFAVRWTGLTAHIQDLDKAIDQLEIIPEWRRDISFIRQAPDDDERAERFTAFWDRRDPSPGTRRNERMEEYYYRVNFANRWYGTAEDGWKTDRGFVLVRFGEPDYIERKPHSFDFEPYEIWVYQRMGRKFIFVDKTGFGDYQLLVPVWDERTRLY